MIKRIHINTHAIRANAKDGGNQPVISVKAGRTNRYANEVDIVDAAGTVVASVIYRPDKPLNCGARVWIETGLDVRLRLTGRAPS